MLAYFYIRHCWLGGRKAIRPVKTEGWGAGVVVCLKQGADLHTAQLMPLQLTVYLLSKIQIGFTFLVPAHLGSHGKRAVKRVCVCNGQDGETHYAKFVWNRCSSFYNTNHSVFCPFGSKRLIHASKMAFFGGRNFNP